MSAWPEATYIVGEIRKALISEELLEDIKDRHTVMAELDKDAQDNYFPKGHSADVYTDESLWFVIEED